jgi:hypothetical protein
MFDGQGMDGWTVEGVGGGARVTQQIFAILRNCLAPHIRTATLITHIRPPSEVCPIKSVCLAARLPRRRIISLLVRKDRRQMPNRRAIPENRRAVHVRIPAVSGGIWCRTRASCAYYFPLATAPRNSHQRPALAPAELHAPG